MAKKILENSVEKNELINLLSVGNYALARSKANAILRDEKASKELHDAASFALNVVKLDPVTIGIGIGTLILLMITAVLVRA